MAKWTVKGIVDDEPKSKQETEQAVLDKAVEKGDIEPESAGQEQEIPKINLDELNKTGDVAQEQKTEEAPASEKPEASKAPDEEVQEQSNESPLELVQDEEPKKLAVEQPKIDQQTAKVNEQPEPVQQTEQTQLPEGVNNLLKFMEETGGGVEDYVNLNRDLDNIKEGDLLREYYKQAKPWDSQEIEEYLEDNFSYDEELDEPREVRAKKRAFKEELFNAKRFLKSNKEKYYAELKLRKQQEVPTEYQEAYQYYGNYKESLEQNKKATEKFLEKTNNVFNEDFKGFNFQVGDNKYRFKVNNIEQTKKAQSDINNFVKDFLGEDGQVSDAAGYHKALFTARNADKLAEHFYEQGRADAIRTSAKEAKNISMDPRQEGVLETKTGKKFKVVSGESSSKLKIKLKN